MGFVEDSNFERGAPATIEMNSGDSLELKFDSDRMSSWLTL
jgi:hypothetical protein